MPTVPRDTRDIYDYYGRRYRVGERDVDLTGRPREWMLGLAWVSMLAISLFQYGFGAAVPALARARGWSVGEALTILAVWVVCQAGVSFPATWLYRRVGPRVPLLVAAVLCAVALLALAHDAGPPVVTYAVLGGVGCGTVYATCIGVVTQWFPERVATRVGFVSGAFGYGALPFVVLVSFADPAVVLDAAAVLVLLAIGVGGLLLSRPPANWWPAHIDPHRFALDRRVNRSIPNNVPAARAFPPWAAVRSGMLPLMFVVVVLTATMALFDIAYLAAHADATPAFTAASLGTLAVAAGLGRVWTGSLSDRLGRKRVLALALVLGGTAQFGLLAAVRGGTLAAVVLFAGLAGAGTSAGYSLLVSLVRDWFGDDATLANYGIVYTGKAFGGVAGIALAGAYVGAPSTVPAFVVAGSLGLLAAALTARLHQPGRPVLSVPGA